MKYSHDNVQFLITCLQSTREAFTGQDVRYRMVQRQSSEGYIARTTIGRLTRAFTVSGILGSSRFALEHSCTCFLLRLESTIGTKAQKAYPKPNE